MCNQSVIEFVKRTTSRQEIRGREILEIGSRIANASIRPVLTSLVPASYTGVDIGPGPGVDVVCRAEEVNKRFGDERFDCVIATEVLEHIENWQTAIHAMKLVLKIGGIMLITTRSRGFDYHGYPHDFWRFERGDMEAIFSDFTIQHLEEDQSCPGIFLKAHKPERFVENDTRRHRLYSVASRRFIDHVGITERILVVTWFPVILLMKKIVHPLVPPVMRRWLRANILSRIPS